MKCPNCGEEMGEGKFRCLRCGYAVKDLSVNVRDDENDDNDEKDETVDIDPSKVYVSGGSAHSGGGVFDDIFGGGLFGGLFGGILDDIFGFGGFDDGRISYDFFGNPVYDEEDEQEEPVRKKAGGVVEIKHVEYLDENDNPIDKKGKRKDAKKSEKNGSGEKKKNPFDKIRDKLRRNDKKD